MRAIDVIGAQYAARRGYNARMFSAVLLFVAAMPTALQSAPAPQIAADKLTHDFGTVGLGTTPEIDFPIRNTGKAPLELTITYVPRGLRLVSLDKTIAAAASGVVRIGVDTFTAGATTEWKVNLLTNDPARGSVELSIKADVRAYLALTPATARFTFVQYGPEGGTKHVLSAVDGSSLEVVGVDSPVDYIKATSRELKGKERVPDVEGRQWEIGLTIASQAPVGPIAGYVVVRTNHPQQPRAFLAVSGFVRPLFAVTPPSVDLTGMAAASPEAPILSLIVKNFGAEAIALTGATSDVAGLDATIVPVDAGHVWKVELRLAPAAGQKGPFKGTLTLATASKDVPELLVPIQGNRTGSE
jgi:hypothetical protein